MGIFPIVQNWASNDAHFLPVTTSGPFSSKTECLEVHVVSRKIQSCSWVNFNFRLFYRSIIVSAETVIPQPYLNEFSPAVWIPRKERQSSRSSFAYGYFSPLPLYPAIYFSTGTISIHTIPHWAISNMELPNPVINPPTGFCTSAKHPKLSHSPQDIRLSGGLRIWENRELPNWSIPCFPDPILQEQPVVSKSIFPLEMEVCPHLHTTVEILPK